MRKSKTFAILLSCYCGNNSGFFIKLHRSEVSILEVKTWKARTDKNLTLVELSKLTGISKTTLNDIENGKTSPTLRQLEYIAIALNVRITDLFDSEYK